MADGVIYRGFDIGKGDDGFFHIRAGGIWIAKAATEYAAMAEVDRIRREAAKRNAESPSERE